MKADFQRRIQRYGWDKASEHYESSWRQQLRRAQLRLLELAALKAGEHVVDIACGTGLTTFPAARAVGPGGDVVGTDLSDQMIERVRTIAHDRDITNVSFERMDAEELSLPDNAFDVVLCSLGLMYVPAPERAVTEMYRVANLGGRALALIWGARKNCGWADIFPIVDRRVASDVCPLFFQQGTGTVLNETFCTAGFSNIESERFNYDLHFDDDDTALAAAFLGGPVALAYNKFTDNVRAEVHAEYLDSIAGFRNGKGYDVPGEFVIVSGGKKRA